MLEKLLTSKTRVKILELLILNADSEFYLRETAKRVGISPAYVKKELENLQELNLILQRKRGNMILFKINKNSPIFEELKSIFLKTESLGEFIRKNLRKLGEIKHALIYGSFAKGRESKESDIDLLVIGSVREEELIEVIREVEGKTGREINYIIWSGNEFREKANKKHHLLMDIIKNPVINIIGDLDEFRKALD
ncbi:MAG: nucleotidyltransferase domain-containing protein [Methanocellales archaeon]|nr:nucleotidyltransferase domain-containing protein [Methanocellales archaeon]